MNRLRYLIAACCLLLTLSSCQHRKDARTEDPADLARAIVDEVRGSVLPFWTDYAPAPDGGFYGTLQRDGTPETDALRSGVLNARILWSFAAAARTWNDTLCLRLANRAQRYFIDTFIDPVHGGVYWLVAPDGTVMNGSKYAYALTYGIYGLAEHYLATGNTESLDTAFSLFRTLEEKGREPVYDGYTETFTEDWKPLEQYDKNAPKTMNAHLHVLEAYTLLYQCRPDQTLKERLERCTRLFMDTIYDAKRKHFNQYFDNQWHSLMDIDSYGHDGEAGWLLCRAADVLGDPELKQRAGRIALDVTRACLDQGLAPAGYLRYERNGDKMASRCSWWGQDEMLIACINAWQISGDKRFLQDARRIWNFVMQNMKDREFGEWFSDCQNGKPIVNAHKADMWRCPYHTTRLATEMQNRLLTHKKN